MQYAILIRQTADWLEDAVNDLIMQGWEPLGGVSYTGSSWSQTMIKQREADDNGPG